MRKNIARTGIIAVTLVAMMSCVTTRSLPQRLDDFVDEAEIKSGSYTTEDWKESGKEYEGLVKEYLKEPDRYSEEEKKLATKAMGRYHALLIKNGIESASSALKELGAVLPEYLDGLSEGIKESGAGLGSLLEGILDTARLNKSLENLGTALEGLFGDGK